MTAAIVIDGRALGQRIKEEAAEHVRDAHEVVVHHDGEMVGGKTI